MLFVRTIKTSFSRKYTMWIESANENNLPPPNQFLLELIKLNMTWLILYKNNKNMIRYKNNINTIYIYMNISKSYK